MEDEREEKAQPPRCGGAAAVGAGGMPLLLLLLVGLADEEVEVIEVEEHALVVMFRMRTTEYKEHRIVSISS